MLTNEYRLKVEYHIGRICHDRGYPDEVVETARLIYEQLHQHSHNYNKPAEHFAVATIYIAAQMHDYPISLNDLSDIIPRQKILNARKAITEYVPIKSLPTPASSYIERWADEFYLPDEIREEALNMVYSNEMNRAPTSIAAAAIYAASKRVDKPLNQSEVADMCGVSEVTIRDIYREFLD